MTKFVGRTLSACSLWLSFSMAGYAQTLQVGANTTPVSLEVQQPTNNTFANSDSFFNQASTLFSLFDSWDWDRLDQYGIGTSRRWHHFDYKIFNSGFNFGRDDVQVSELNWGGASNTINLKAQSSATTIGDRDTVEIWIAPPAWTINQNMLDYDWIPINEETNQVINSLPADFDFGNKETPTHITESIGSSKLSFGALIDTRRSDRKNQGTAFALFNGLRGQVSVLNYSSGESHGYYSIHSLFDEKITHPAGTPFISVSQYLASASYSGGVEFGNENVSALLGGYLGTTIAYMHDQHHLRNLDIFAAGAGATAGLFGEATMNLGENLSLNMGADVNFAYSPGQWLLWEQGPTSRALASSVLFGDTSGYRIDQVNYNRSVNFDLSYKF